MNIKTLQDLLNRSNGAAEITLTGESIEEYREILKDAMRFQFIWERVETKSTDLFGNMWWRFGGPYKGGMRETVDALINQSIKDE